MPTGAEQAAIARGLANSGNAIGNYAEAYRYIESQVRGDPAWHPGLADWFGDAAKINGPDNNVLKQWAYDFNSTVKGWDPDSDYAWQENQRVSNIIARDVIERYARGIPGTGIPGTQY